jgi:hypothetical protein
MNQQKNIFPHINEKNTSTKFNLRELGVISFGQLEGEKDSKLNSDTFFPTETIKQLLCKHYNYVLSPKGVGKSAIFNAITNKFVPQSLFEYSKHSIIPINKAFGNDNEYLDPSKFKEEEGRKNYSVYWGLYIMSELLKDIFKNHSDKFNFESFKSKIKKVEGLKDKFQLYNVLEIINQLNIGFAFNISGQTIEIKPNIKYDSQLEKLSLNEIFQIINDFYYENNLDALIVIDRIDSFVSKESIEIQKNYLQGLIDCIEEITFYKNLDPLLFLRTDLFYSFDIKFEYDKVKERKIELKWEESEILNFIVYRFISNKYIIENFIGHFLNIYNESSQTELNKNEGFFDRIKNWLSSIFLYKRQNKFKNKNIPYQTAEKFIKLFFPSKLAFSNNQDFCDWIFEKFKDSNGFINPRVLIFFFNKLFENQYLFFRQNNNHSEVLEVDLKVNSYSHFQIFDEAIIERTFTNASQEEIINIYKLLKSKHHQILFKEINIKSFETGKFRTGDLNIKNLGIEREELEALLIHLKLLGFCNETEKQHFQVPPIYRNKLEPPSSVS